MNWMNARPQLVAEEAIDLAAMLGVRRVDRVSDVDSTPCRAAVAPSPRITSSNEPLPPLSTR